MRALSAIGVAVAVPALAGCATDGKVAAQDQILILAKEIPANLMLSLTVLITGAVIAVASLAAALRGSEQEELPTATQKISADAQAD